MKKTVIIFIFLVFVLVLLKLLYTKYCHSKPEGCKKEVYDENQGLPQEGIDW
jgi:hypothetical protein